MPMWPMRKNNHEMGEGGLPDWQGGRYAKLRLGRGGVVVLKRAYVFGWIDFAI